MLRVGLVAGEASGDLLGAGLIEAIKARVPDAVFEGIAGPQMAGQGCKALFPADRLAIMGIVEVLGHYFQLRRMRSRLIRHFINDPPDIFVGIDAPDFNLGLETRLRAAGIPTVHYVSPSVWAWREYRINKIRKAVDLMLTLFPFEEEFYRNHQIPVRYVGHPLADVIALENDARQARSRLGLPADNTIVALLPGSRTTELQHLGRLFIETATWCQERRPELHFVAPFVNEKTRSIFEHNLRHYAPNLEITLIDGRSREAMTASDVVLLASGTATLEALLLRRPMVVAYRLAPLSYRIARRLLKISQYSLPNLLAGKSIVPEFIQEQATPANLGGALLGFLDDPAAVADLRLQFEHIHRLLRRHADVEAAEGILALIDRQ
jgi:lipid-A-disaccharide synthase